VDEGGLLTTKTKNSRQTKKTTMGHNWNWPINERRKTVQEFF
jgi:hypothetical protein